MKSGVGKYVFVAAVLILLVTSVGFASAFNFVDWIKEIGAKITGYSVAGDSAPTVFNITRSFSSTEYAPGVPITVSIFVEAPGTPIIASYVVEETIPAGWGVTFPASSKGRLFPGNLVKFGIFNDGSGEIYPNRIITYTATPPIGETGIKTFSGTLFGSDYDQISYALNVDGANTLNIQSHTLSVSKSGTGSGSVTSSPSGINCGGTCSASFNQGTSVTLSATPNVDSTFASWTGCDSATGNICTVSMSNAKSVSATFTLIPFDYSLSTPGVSITQGSTSSQTVTITRTQGTAATTTVSVGTLPSGVTLTSANSQTCTPTSGSCSVTFTYSATTVAAVGTTTVSTTGTSPGVANKNSNFALVITAIPTYTLSVSKSGTGSGSVTSSPSGINCGGTCSASFNQGTSVTLTAASNSDSTFAGWSGACSGTGTCVVSSAATVTATFTLIPFDYSLSTPGVSITQGSTSSQTVTITRTQGTAAPVTVSVGTLPSGVTLTSANAQSCTPTSGSCSVTFTYSATIAAAVGTTTISTTGTSPGVANKNSNFALTVNAIPTFAINLVKAGTGTGTVTSNPSGINCGGTCSASFNQGTSVTLTAATSADSTFAGWSGACSGTGTCVVSSAATVTATFTLIPFDYSLSASSVTITQGSTGSNTATVTRTQGTAAPVTVSVGTLPSGVTLTSANSQTCTPTTGTCSVTFTYSATIAAAVGTTTVSTTGTSGTLTKNSNFALAITAIPTYTLSVSKAGTGTGTITSSPSGINCGATCGASYNQGTSVTLTSTPNTDSTFASWTGCDSATGNICTVSMSNAKSVSATFTLIPFDYSLSASSVTITQGSTGSNTATVTRTQGTAAPVTVSVGTLPSGVTLTSANSQTCTPTTGTCSVTFTYSATIAAAVGTTTVSTTGTSGTLTKNSNFALAITAIPTYTLSVSKSGTGSGSVTSSPSGINCGATCGASFNSMSTVTLTATSNADSTFSSWSGACSGTGTCLIVMNETKSAIAIFNLNPPVQPTGLSATAISTSQVNLGWNALSGASSYKVYRSTTPGAEVMLTSVGLNSYSDSALTAGTTYYYKVSAVNSAGEGTLSSEVSATTFKITPILTIAISPSSSVLQGAQTSVSGNGCPSGVTCTLTRNAVAVSNPDTQTLSAGVYQYNYSTTGNTQYNSARVSDTLVVNAPATFALNVDKTGSGSVTSGDGKINCGATCGASYTSGESAVLTATASVGYTFKNWTGTGCSGTAQTCTLTITSNVNPVANFAPIVHTLTYITSNSGLGSISVNPSGVTSASCSGITTVTCTQGYNYATNVVLTATASSAGSTFASWSGCDSATGNTCTVSMINAKSVTATFNVVPFDFSLTNNGNKNVNQGSSVAELINASLLSGNTQAVSFSISGLPSGVSSTFSPVSCSPGCSSVATLTASSSATAGTYSVTVAATSGSLTKSTVFSLTVVTFTPPTIPTAPSNLVATTAGINQINLAWQDNSNNENGFNIYRDSGRVFFLVGNVGAGVTSYINTGLSPGSTYSYKVSAFNSAGESILSSAITASTTSQSPPNAPSNLIATGISPSVISLTWTDNSNNENQFVILRTNNVRKTPFVEIARTNAVSGTGNTVGYNNTGLSAGATYYYKVYANNVYGASSVSAAVSGKTKTCSWWKRTFGLSC